MNLNHKKTLTFLVLVLAVILIAGRAQIISNMEQWRDNSRLSRWFSQDTYTYVIPEAICKLCFSRSPQEFCETLDAPEPPLMFESYTVDRNGNLIIVATEKQKKAWKKRMSIFRGQKSGIEISDDYTKITVDYYKDDFTAIIEALPYCANMQVLSGKNGNDILIECFLLGNEGEILSHSVFPTQDGSFSWNIDVNSIEKK